MTTMRKQIEEATEAVKKQLGGGNVDIGLILGSGLGGLADEVEGAVRINYEDIPGFPTSTVEGHAGRLVLGELEGKNVVAMQGRFHFYEGYSAQEVTFPVRVMKALGVHTLIVTNACGGMNRNYRPGDFMLIADHLNMTGTNPLIGPNDEELGTRFPDMSQAYSPTLIDLAKRIAGEEAITIHEGVYTGISGPSFMTKAELAMLRKLGGDVVGMSTVPEVIVARHAGIEVLGISCVTDMAVADDHGGVSHEEVMETAARTKPTFIKYVRRILNNIS
ncbi:purine-nucleoside phosphorylase [Salicibibacter halophilus]|uniref:Purine nucleoside phosphorylase n=2 Tax=Salicibibacter halophilus TaxID=2502791 RepID=A0A514LDH2_9BACI|nr:purine-nucleoside phosphorylase [Salicibibacter halophilus]QDI89896.1 purine-nucleoside phosphorylase [Salicibibacter halophilus]